MTETTPATESVDEQRTRRRAEVPNHYRESLTHLGLAAEAQEPDARSAHAALAQAHATMLQANEQRVGNLIGYLAVLRSSALTDVGRARVTAIEERIDVALGTGEIQPETAGA